MLFYFGYANYPNQEEENPTGFYDYQAASDELIATSYGFRKTNEEQIKIAIDIADGKAQVKEYHNADSSRIPHPPSDAWFLGEASLNFAQRKLGFVSDENKQMPWSAYTVVMFIAQVTLRYFLTERTIAERVAEGVFVFVRL